MFLGEHSKSQSFNPILQDFLKKTLLVFFLFSGFKAYSQIALDTWLVGQYNFNTVTTDQSRFHNDLPNPGLNFGPDRFCNDSEAIYFNGTQSLVLNKTNGMANVDAYTFTVWIKPEALFSSLGTLIDIGSDPGKANGQRLVYLNSGSVLASSGIDGTKINPSNAQSAPTGNWVFVAVTLDRRGGYNFYIDGNLVQAIPQATNTKIYYDSFTSPALNVGGDPGGGNYFKGYMDDLHIYNEALDAATIKAIYGYGSENQIQVITAKLCINQPISFSLDGKNANSITWNFGDGSPVTSPNTDYKESHVYKKPGPYIVTALLTTKCSVHAPVTTVVQIGACEPPCKLPTQISLASDSCLETQIVFDLGADHSLKTVIWDYGDQTQSTSTVYPFQGKHQYTAPGNYTIKAEVADTCSQGKALEYTNLMVLSCLPQPIPIIPSAFTPNGDGMNDRWEIPELINYPKCNLKVYDRWGNLVFLSPKGYAQPFDGFYKGKRLPEGAYYYVVLLKDGLKPLVGSVSILY